MQYIIKDTNGEEHGPIDSETLAKWVDEDRVMAETPVRSSLMPNWKTADQINFLVERLAEQELRRQASATMVEKSGSILHKAKKRLGDKFSPNIQSKFEQKRPPQYARMSPRFLAGLYDFTLIILIGGILYALGIAYAYKYPAAKTDSSRAGIAEKDNMMIPILAAERSRRLEIEGRFEAVRKVEKGEELEAAKKEFEAEFAAEKAKSAEIRDELHENNLTATCPPYTFADKNAGYQISSLWEDTTSGEKYICLSGAPGAARWLSGKVLTKIVTYCIAALVLITLALYAFFIGYYSQTYGMWFWGIFITKRKIGEVYFLRAFMFTLLYPFCFIFSPLFVYIFHRGLHEILSGTRLIRIFSKRDA